MQETDRSKLVKLLRMFSSDFDGEVASAARRAHELVRARALDWDDLLIQPRRAGGHNPHAGFANGTYSRQPRDRTNSQVDHIRRCGELDEYLTGWENNFIASIADSIQEWGHLTPKQQAVLNRIIDKLKSIGIWEGEPW